MIGGDFAKFCGLLKIYELYNTEADFGVVKFELLKIDQLKTDLDI